MKIPKFKEELMEELDQFLVEWDKNRRGKRGLPDNTSDAIFLLPLAFALLESSNKLGWLTKVLLVLTFILAVETFILLSLKLEFLF